MNIPFVPRILWVWEFPYPLILQGSFASHVLTHESPNTEKEACHLCAVFFFVLAGKSTFFFSFAWMNILNMSISNGFNGILYYCLLLISTTLPSNFQPGLVGIQVQGWYKEIVAKTIVRMQRNVGNFVRDFWRFLEAKKMAVPLSCHERLLFDQKQTTAQDNLSDIKLRIEIEWQWETYVYIEEVKTNYRLIYNWTNKISQVPKILRKQPRFSPNHRKFSPHLPTISDESEPFLPIDLKSILGTCFLRV